jgi:hypothetical protein
MDRQGRCMTEIRIHRQNRRSMVMKRTPVGLVVFIPRWLKPDSPKVRQFIEEGIQKLGIPAPTVEQSSTNDLRSLLALWSQRLGVQPARVQFRDMYQKWGSCSSKGNITLNTALCRVPCICGCSIMAGNSRRSCPRTCPTGKPASRRSISFYATRK